MVDKKNKKEVIKQPKKEVKQTKKKDVKQPKKEVKQTKKNVKQPKKEEYIYNPDTKRNVKKNGDVGKKVLEKYGGGAALSIPALSPSLSRCRVTTGTSTQNHKETNKHVTKTSAKQNHYFQCCLTKSTKKNFNDKLSINSNKKLNTINLENTLNSRNVSNSGLCFDFNTHFDQEFVEEIFKLIDELTKLDQSEKLVKYEKYTISKKAANTTNANTQTFEITITPPPNDPPNPPSSPSGGCDININYDNNSNTVTITKIETEKCGLNTDKLEEFKKLIKQILDEIFKEFVNIFNKIHQIDVNGLVKGVIIAIIVDTIFEDLCKDGSKKQKICNYPEIKILMNVAANNPTAPPIQIIAKTTIGIVKSKSELTTLQDMIRKFYVAKHFEQLKQLKAMFNLQ